jgi:hypothetical protein
VKHLQLTPSSSTSSKGKQSIGQMSTEGLQSWACLYLTWILHLTLQFTADLMGTLVVVWEQDLSNMILHLVMTKCSLSCSCKWRCNSDWEKTSNYSCGRNLGQYLCFCLKSHVAFFVCTKMVSYKCCCQQLNYVIADNERRWGLSNMALWNQAWIYCPL